MKRLAFTNFVILAFLIPLLGYGGWVMCLEFRICPVPPPEVPLSQLRADFERSNLFTSASPSAVGEPSNQYGRPIQRIQSSGVHTFAIRDWLVFRDDQTLVVLVDVTVMLANNRTLAGTASLAYRKNGQNLWDYVGGNSSNLELQNPTPLSAGP